MIWDRPNPVNVGRTVDAVLQRLQKPFSEIFCQEKRLSDLTFSFFEVDQPYQRRVLIEKYY
jgi:hypothetical protein